MRRLLATAVLAAGLTLGAQAAQAASPAPSLSPDLGYAGSSTGILVQPSLAAAEVSGTAADAANDRILAVGTAENTGGTRRHPRDLAPRQRDPPTARSVPGRRVHTCRCRRRATTRQAWRSRWGCDHRVLVLGSVVDNGGLSRWCSRA